MSRWTKRTEEEKQKILRERDCPPHRWAKTSPSFDMIKPECEKAKKAAGHPTDKHCSACDLRCPGCPFESAWPKEVKNANTPV